MESASNRTTDERRSTTHFSMSDRDRVTAILTAILTLAEAATPGPWSTDWWYLVAEVPNGRPGGEVIGQMSPSVSKLIPHEQRKANAAYVAAVCNAFPDVAAALLEALDTIDRVEGENGELIDWRNNLAGQLDRALRTIAELTGEVQDQANREAPGV